MLYKLLNAPTLQELKNDSMAYFDKGFYSMNDFTKESDGSYSVHIFNPDIGFGNSSAPSGSSEVSPQDISNLQSEITNLSNSIGSGLSKTVQNEINKALASASKDLKSGVSQAQFSSLKSTVDSLSNAINTLNDKYASESDFKTLQSDVSNIKAKNINPSDFASESDLNNIKSDISELKEHPSNNVNSSDFVSYSAYDSFVSDYNAYKGNVNSELKTKETTSNHNQDIQKLTNEINSRLTQQNIQALITTSINKTVSNLVSDKDFKSITDSLTSSIASITKEISNDSSQINDISNLKSSIDTINKILSSDSNNIDKINKISPQIQNISNSLKNLPELQKEINTVMGDFSKIQSSLSSADAIKAGNIQLLKELEKTTPDIPLALFDTGTGEIPDDPIVKTQLDGPWYRIGPANPDKTYCFVSFSGQIGDGAWGGFGNNLQVRTGNFYINDGIVALVVIMSNEGLSLYTFKQVTGGSRNCAWIKFNVGGKNASDVINIAGIIASLQSK